MTAGLRSLLLAAASSLAFAGGAAAQTLTIAVGAPVTSIDPHYHNLSPNNALAEHLFDGLTGTDSRARLVPRLAESWRAVDDTTWEFKLRPGVKFHNGNDFTAEDVAFTIARAGNVPNSPSSFGIYTRVVSEVQVVDAHTVRLRTRTTYPLLPVDLSNVMMLDRQTHENAATEDYNSGKVAFGTGAYRFVRYTPGDRIELERNEAYWGQREPWQRVNYRTAGGRRRLHRPGADHRHRAHEAGQPRACQRGGGAADHLSRARPLAHRRLALRGRTER
jgi:peptide/nickel transport system substrate-binding protein